MKRLSCAFLMFFAFAGSSAFAQVDNLSGQFVCVQNCISNVPGQFAYVTQNGWSVNLVNEGGIASRGWIDRPGHLWAEFWQEGAVYTPDGNTIQFDNGTVWERYVPPPPPLLLPYHPRRHYVIHHVHHVVHHLRNGS